MFATVHSRSCRVTAYILRLLQTAQQSHLLHFGNSRNISFATVLSRSCRITAYILRLPQTALLCDLQCVQPSRLAIARNAPAITKAEFGAAHSRRRNLERHIAAKTADMISHACRLSYQLYIPSNRIVKPNNRYTRQPASHDFLFYSAPDKVYVLTTTNRIAMRFAVRSAPPFRYPADSSNSFKGGT